MSAQITMFKHECAHPDVQVEYTGSQLVCQYMRPTRAVDVSVLLRHAALELLCSENGLGLSCARGAVLCNCRVTAHKMLASTRPQAPRPDAWSFSDSTAVTSATGAQLFEHVVSLPHAPWHASTFEQACSTVVPTR